MNGIDEEGTMQTVGQKNTKCRCSMGPGCPVHHHPCTRCGEPAFYNTEGDPRHAGKGTHADQRCVK